MLKKQAACLMAGCLMFSLTLCGCSGTTEVRDRMFIQAASLKSSRTQTALTLYPYEPPGTHIDSHGMTLQAAAEEAAVRAGKEVFLGHLELLCTQDSATFPSLSRCMEEYRLSPSCHLLYLAEEDALEEQDTLVLTDALKQEEKNGRIPKTDLFHVLSELSGHDHTALVPVLSKDGFGMGIVQDDTYLKTLSEGAITGLCWLRGENFPQRISVAGNTQTEDYEIHMASTDLSAEIKEGIPHVTVHIRIRGTGNHEAAERLIAVRCAEAIEETIKECNADVIGFSDCLRRDCPSYEAAQDFTTAKWAAIFSYEIQAQD